MNSTTMKKWNEVGSRFCVAGVKFGDYQKVLKQLKLGAQVRFIGESSNKYDNLAIRIELNGTKLGYVPSSKNPKNGNLQYDLWKLHNRGAVLIGVITAYCPTNSTYDMITIQALSKQVKTGVSKRVGDVEFSKMKAELSYV